MSKTVLTIGTFDMLHVGHIELLQACHELADGGEVIVGVNSDFFVRDYKGQGPVMGSRQRMEMLGAIRYVSAVFVHYGPRDAESDITRWHADIIAVGDDWKDRDYLGQLGVTQEWLDERGIEVVYVPRTTGESTTSLRERLAAR